MKFVDFTLSFFRYLRIKDIRMKKQKLLILSLLPLILSACNGQEASSSSSAESKETSSQQSSSSMFIKEETTIENVRAALMEAQNGDFELVYNLNGKEYRDYYTDEYVLLGSSSAGYILLNSYKASDGKITYFFSVDDEGKVTIHDIYSSSLKSLSSFNLLSGIRANKLTEKDFNEGTSTIKSTNKNLLDAFSSLLELGETYDSGYISGIEFYFNDQNGLVFTLSQPAATPSTYVVSASLRTGVLENIGKASSKEVEEAASSFSISSEAISSSALTPLTNKKFEGHGTLSQSIDGVVSSMGTFSLIYNETSIEIRYDIDDISQFAHYEKASNGNVKRQTLSPENIMVETDQSIAWSDLAFGYNSVTESDAFRKVSDNLYHYYGYNATSIGGAFTYLDYGSNASSIDLHLTNGVVSSLTIKTPQIGKDTLSRTVYYIMEIDVASSPSDPWVVSPLTKVDAKIKTAIDAITNQGVSYVAKSSIASTNKSYAETTVTEDTILVKKMLIGDDTETIYSYDGYHLLSDGKVQAFTIDDENNITLGKSPVEGDTLMAHCGFSCSPAVFELSKDGKSFSPIAEATSFAGFLTAGFFSDYAVDDTLVFNLSDDGKISSFSYDYNLSGLSRQKETVEFTYGNATIDSELKKKIDAIEAASNPTNWLEEKNSTGEGSQNKLKSYLIEVYGEETAATIPYVYDAEMSGEWWFIDRHTSEDTTNPVTIDFGIYSGTTYLNETKWNAYKAKLVDALTTAGYALSSGAYIKGNVKITIGDSETGIHFYTVS